MAYKSKQCILQGGILSGREAFKDMFNILIHQGNANPNAVEIPSYIVSMAKIKKK